MPNSQKICELVLEKNYEDLAKLLREEFTFTEQDDYEDLCLALATLITAETLKKTKKTLLTRNIINRIDTKLLSDDLQADLAWAVTNPRGVGGKSDVSFLALNDLIAAGFNISHAKTPGGDLFSEIARQAGGVNLNTDVELVKLILKTGTIQGFEGELANQLLEDLENKKFHEAILLQLRSTEKGFNYDHTLYQTRHQIYSNWHQENILEEVTRISTIEPFYKEAWGEIDDRGLDTSNKIKLKNPRSQKVGVIEEDKIPATITGTNKATTLAPTRPNCCVIL